MKLSDEMRANCPSPENKNCGCGWVEYANEVAQLEARLASARAIMQKLVDKVDSGIARSTETYAEMKEWMEDV